jgi:uncharacterized membrane protein YtjA (UPF0391 family)
MGAYLTFWTTGLGVVLALIAVLLLHGGWEAAAAGIAIAMGTVCLSALFVLWIESDRMA